MQPGKGLGTGAAQACRCAAATLLLGVSASCLAHDDGQLPGETDSPVPIDQTLKATQKGHGSMSIAYGNTYVNGFHQTSDDVLPTGTVHGSRVDLDLDYFVADHWSVHVGLPYIRNKYQGPAPHCPTSAPPQCANIPALAHPHPESAFLDDGEYHSTWQDWNFGVAYHANVGGYVIVPSVNVYLPTHDYAYFTNTAVGQDLQRVEVGASLAHQFDFSNIYYRVGFGRVFSEKTLGQSIDYNKLDLEAGYFLNDKWTAKVFVTGKKGNGYKGAYDQTSELWFHHDQRAPHNYASAGFGADYHLNDKYTLTSSLQREIYGRFIFNFKYAFELRLTREF